MKILTYSKDGGKESTVVGFFFVKNHIAIPATAIIKVGDSAL